MNPKSLYCKDDKRRPKDESPSRLGEESYRSAFRRDYARVLHSAHFRRLQGKTQLFPGAESDFFRNRLTHSLEVAQIAKSIATRINHTNPSFKGRNKIDLDLVELAGLAHDLGHPPFGHNGELALDELMASDGGFEGNAQTLRVLSTIAKHTRRAVDHEHGIDAGTDNRAGLNLTYRAFASILKYDKRIPRTRKNPQKPVKGYYETDKDLVSDIKNAVCGDRNRRSFKTVECWIMDVADDIAYSTYDLEDAFKAEFLSPIQILGLQESKRKLILESVNHELDTHITLGRLNAKISEIMRWVFDDMLVELDAKIDVDTSDGILTAAALLYNFSQTIAKNGYDRTHLTSYLIGRFVRDIEVTTADCLPLSQVHLSEETRIAVEVLKKISYISLINSSRLKVSEFRGKQIVREIFESIDQDGSELLPPDYKAIYDGLSDEDDKRRVTCDFVSGMTDRYALEFYSRLKSVNAETIFKPI